MNTGSQINLANNSLSETIYQHIANRDINGIVEVLEKVNSKSEYNDLCIEFSKKYNYSFYNKIWNFISPEDYERVNLAMRKANC